MPRTCSSTNRRPGRTGDREWGALCARRSRTAHTAGYVVLLMIPPWTGFVLILIADGRVAYTLLPWESRLPAGSSRPVSQPAAAALETRARPPERN
jgi:hypothetical protein